MNTRIVIVSKDTNFKLLQTEFDKVNDIANVMVTYVSNNSKPLSIIYNEYLREARKNLDALDNLVLMHSDVSFNTISFIKHL
jgi:hypothetical protein